MQSFFIFLNTKTMRIVGKVQLLVALSVYFYFAWSSSPIQVNAYPDWLMHYIGNCFLYGSFWWAFFYRRISWLLLFMLLPFSLAVEFGQALNPYRSVSVTDMLANILGLGTASVIGLCLQPFIPRASVPD